MARGRIVKVETKKGTRYRIIYEAGPDPVTGNRRRKTETLDKKEDAEKRLTDLLRARDTGMLADPKKMTVSQYLDYWYENYAEINLAPSTLESYRVIIERHLKPALGNLKIEKLAPSHIQSHYTKALKSGRKTNKKSYGEGLSPSYVNYHHRVLRKALDHAVRWQIIPTNPALRCAPPKREKIEMQTFTPEEITRLLDEVRGTYLYMPVYLAATTGMRQGEILALAWADVDLAAGAITVRRTLQRFKKGEKPVFKEPKTSGSRRRVNLSSEVVRELKRYQRVDWNEKKISAGKAWQKYNLVCCYDDGSPIPPATFARAFRDVTRRLGMAGRFHDLRHTVASLLLARGVHPKIVAELLGHSSTGITLDIYSHVAPTLGKEAAEILGDQLFGKK